MAERLTEAQSRSIGEHPGAYVVWIDKPATEMDRLELLGLVERLLGNRTLEVSNAESSTSE